jgi:putative acetyltransferase
MKIRKVTKETEAKVYGLLQLAFPGSDYEANLVKKLHEKNRPVHEWICIHAGKAIAYIAFSIAYRNNEVCGLHLAPMAVTPEFQKQGVGSELLRFTLRQEAVKDQPLFVLGEPEYYKRFGFESCRAPICPFDKENAHFLSMRNQTADSFTIGYEPEFLTAATAARPEGKSRR